MKKFEPYFMTQMRMMRRILGWALHLLLASIAVLVTEKVVPGMRVESWITALWVAFALGILNVTLRPLLLFIAIPINFLSMGLFTLVINAGILLLIGRFVPGFHLESFWSALLCGMVLSLLGWFFSFLEPKTAVE